MEEVFDIQPGIMESHAELQAEVKNLIGNPLSVWAVAATLESLGVREVDARREYGFDSIFALADSIYHELKKEIREEDRPEVLSKEHLHSPGTWSRIRYFVTNYFQGFLFSLPLISQILALFIFRYSLWAWLDFNEAQATLVAFGTITAFVVTGGFIQVLGHSISSYASSNNYYLAYESSKKIVKAGIAGVSAICFVIVLTNIVIPFYPWSMVVLAVIYTLLISLLLLTSGVLFALKRRLSILIIIILGTLLVIVNMEVLHLSIYLSQWLGMFATSLLLAGYARYYFKRSILNKQDNPVLQSLPAVEVRSYINYRYFIYGTSYFLFIFMDRLLAWSTGEPPPPFILWFNTPYEIGMDWALITLILSFAMLEYSVNIFSRALKALQENVWFQEIDRFHDYFKRLYFNQLLLIVATGLISIVLTYYAVSSLIVYQDSIPEVRDFFTNFMTTKVFLIASISYLFLNIGLLHCLFFFTLSKPAFAMHSILAGLAVNFTIGFLCSRIISPEYATLGLLAGSIVFAVVSGLMARTFFKRLDYYYYSAF